MTALLKYAAACRTLSEAKSFDEVRTIRDEMEHVKLYGKQIKDRTLIAEATEVQTIAERRLGELLLEADKAGWLTHGRPKKTKPENVTSPEQFTLEEAGIDRKLSARSQKLAEMPIDEFHQGLSEVRERIISGDATIINGARAIMASREEASDSADMFPTPPWATRALAEVVLPHCGVPMPLRRAWEPACGHGHMAEVLREYSQCVIASDRYTYGYGLADIDFLSDACPATIAPDWIITNPPFGDKGENFVLRAIPLAKVGVAMFFRLQWLESVGRYEKIFSLYPPAMIAQFAERVPLHKGRWEPEGTTATAYLWIVWMKQQSVVTEFFWIPPGQREALTRADDIERFTVHPVIKKNHQSDVHVPPHRAPSPERAPSSLESPDGARSTFS